jgi:hypothetical protein
MIPFSIGGTSTAYVSLVDSTVNRSETADRFAIVQPGCTRGALSVAIDGPQASILEFAVRAAPLVNMVSSAYQTGVSCNILPGFTSCSSGLIDMSQGIPANGLVDLAASNQPSPPHQRLTFRSVRTIITFTCF